MIETVNNPAFNRYMLIEEMYFTLAVREGRLKEIQNSRQYQEFENLLLSITTGISLSCEPLS